MANKIDYRLDENGLAHLWQRIKLLVTNNVSNKVDKVDGKGLSTNDYTNAEKTKLAGIADGAQKNVQPDWSLTSGDGAIKNKPTIPTKTSQLTNDSYYQTEYDVNSKINTKLGELDYDFANAKNETVTTTPESGTGADVYVTSISETDGVISAKKWSFGNMFNRHVKRSNIPDITQVRSEINTAVGKITSFEYKVVSELPPESDGEKGTIYLLRNSGNNNTNYFDEYILVDAFTGSDGILYSTHWEKIGTTDIDLTPYAKKTEIPTKVSQLTNDANYATQNYAYNTIRDEITDLDYSDTAEEGKYVSSVSETDGVISVTRANFADAIPAITETEIDNICTF